MNFADNTGKTIQQAFEEFHTTHPKVYMHFCRLAFIAIRAGRKRISFRALLNVIRWEIFLQPESDDKTQLTLEGDKIRKFKINDAYSPYYARLFVKEFPEYENLVEFRRLRTSTVIPTQAT